MISGFKEDKRLPSISDLVGEYTTWTFRWTVDLNPRGIDNLVMLVDNLGNVIVMEGGGGAGFSWIDINGNETWYNQDDPLLAIWDNNHSVDNKFIVTIDWNLANERIRVYRYGVPIWVRDPALDYAGITDIAWCSMSPNGRFIAISVVDPVTVDDDRVMFYEGS